MDTPQFQTAEYAGAKGGDLCQLCKRPVGATYYRVGKAMACQACAEKSRSEAPTDSHSAFARGMLFGIGGAIAGLAMYATFAIVTGLVIGYVSLAVGYVVGKAMMAGSKGFGGRRYQISAVILTYAAVSLAAIPISISQYVKQRDARREAQTALAARSKSTSPTATSSEPSTASPQSDGQVVVDGDLPPDSTPSEPTTFGKAVVALLLQGLASPFLELQDGFHGVIGLVILFVGMKFAWQATAGNPISLVSGPFKNTAVPSAPPGLG